MHVAVSLAPRDFLVSGYLRFVSRAPGDVYLGRLEIFDLGRERVATFYALFPLSARDHLSEPSDILGPYFLGSLLETSCDFWLKSQVLDHVTAYFDNDDDKD